MTYTGEENHDISLAQASEMTKRYRENMTAEQTVIAEYFGKDAIMKILKQDHCVGIRAYYALDANMVQNLVLVGVDSNGDDQYLESLAENGLAFPPYGSSPNPLNC